MLSLGMALKNRMARPVTPEDVDHIVGMIDDTASAIERSRRLDTEPGPCEVSAKREGTR